MTVIVMDKATDVRDAICKYFLLSISTTAEDSAYHPMPRGSSLATSYGGEDQVRDAHLAEIDMLQVRLI